MKAKLREKYLKIRENILNRKEKDQDIFNQVINNEKIKSAKIILSYVSYNNEVDTINLLNYFLDKKKVAIPKIENGQMNFYFIKSLNDLKEGYAHILEPTTSEKVTDFKKAVCLTPGICFSKDCYRLGYGGGFYDRFFAQNKIYRIGLCYKECLIDNIYNDEYDQKVDEIITNRR